jgi:transcriptional regulator with XRE-family HTH domain
VANIGGKIRQLRKERGLTQVQVSQLSGVSQSAISDIESGRVTKLPNIDTVGKIASALGCTVAELLGEGAPAAAPSDGLTPTERQLILDFRQLNDQGVQYVLQSMAMALALSKSQGHGLADVALSG